MGSGRELLSVFLFLSSLIINRHGGGVRGSHISNSVMSFIDWPDTANRCRPEGTAVCVTSGFHRKARVANAGRWRKGEVSKKVASD